MSKATPILAIQIHLNDGNVLTFVQNDAKAAQHILDHIHPDRLFSQPHLVIAGPHSMTAVATASIACLELAARTMPSWPFHFNARGIVQIPEDEFRHRYRPLEAQTTRFDRDVAPGREIVTFAQIELANGKNLFLEVLIEPEPRNPLDLNIFIQRMFSTHGLHARQKDGGAIIINPHNVVRFSFFPGPPETPPGAWSADPVA